MKREIGDFPGIDKSKAKPPAPPKFLEISGKGGEAKIVKVESESKARGAPPPLRIQSSFGTPLVASQLSSSTPPKSYDQPPHRYRTAVDSKSEAKGSHSSPARSVASFRETYTEERRGPPPKFIGSSFAQMPNSGFRYHGPAPKAPTVLRPSVPESKSSFSDVPLLLNNRMPDGTILGTNVRRFVDSANVPDASAYSLPEPLAPDVGPDNPVKQLNDTWSACWDDEAGAVYYYNHSTGEATWLPPKL